MSIRKRRSDRSGRSPLLSLGRPPVAGRLEWSFAELNGARGLVLRQGGEVVATVSFAFDRSDCVTDIFIVRNPDKLAALSDTSIH